MLNESSFAGISASVSPLIADEESAILEFLLAQAKASMERGDSIPKLYQEQLSVFDRVLRRATRSSKLVMRAATSAVRAELARSTRNDVESVGGSLADLPRAVRSELATSSTNTLVGVRDIVRRDNLAMADGARRLWTDVVASGVSAYNSGSLSLGDALRQMAERLGEGGISIIDYRSGQKTSIEAAIMRHLRTQLGQAACANTLATCQAIGCTLVEVTRTAAPRPSHAKWEGKVYRITDDRSDYPDFWEGTGYEGKRGPYTRLGDRLQGVNCGHSIAPYYDWMEPRWGDDPLSEEEKEERYRLTQTQRRYEREIRKAKRQASLLESQGLPNAKARIKIGTYQKKVRTLVSENEDVLRREPAREWATTKDGKQPVALRSKAAGEAERSIKSKRRATEGTKVDMRVIDSDEWKAKFSGLTGHPQVDAALRSVTRSILVHRSGTNMEDVVLVDSRTGAVVAESRSSGEPLHVSATEEMLAAVDVAPRGILIGVHNHPNSLPPSIDDFNAAFRRGYERGVITCHDGTVYEYRQGAGVVPESALDAAVYSVRMQNIGANLSERDTLERALMQLGPEYGIEWRRL